MESTYRYTDSSDSEELSLDNFTVQRYDLLFLFLLLHTEEYNKNCVMEVNIGL